MSEFQPNPITMLFPLAVGGFAWQVHGLLIGVIVTIVFIGVTIASNAQIMSTETDDWIRRVQSRKWIIFIVFMVAIAVSGASTSDI